MITRWMSHFATRAARWRPQAVVAVAVLAGLVGCQAPPERLPDVSPQLTLRDRLFDVARTGSGAFVVAGYGGRIFRSEDDGRTWGAVPSPTSAALLRIRFSGETGWIAGQDGMLLRSTDGGRSWAAMEGPADVHWFGLALPGPDHVILCGDRSSWAETRDGGETWAHRTIPRSEVGVTDWVALAVGDPVFYDVEVSDGVVWVVGDYGNIRVTRDFGETWSDQHDALLGQRLPGLTRPARDALDFPALFEIEMRDDGSGLVAGVDGLLLETDDRGATWRRVEPGLEPRVTEPLLRALPLGDGWMVFGRGGEILRRTTGSWERVEANLPLVTWLAGGVITDDGVGIATGGRGMILRTADSGASWKPVGWRPE